MPPVPPICYASVSKPVNIILGPFLAGSAIIKTGQNGHRDEQLQSARFSVQCEQKWIENSATNGGNNNMCYIEIQSVF